MPLEVGASHLRLLPEGFLDITFTEQTNPRLGGGTNLGRPLPLAHRDHPDFPVPPEGNEVRLDLLPT